MAYIDETVFEKQYPHRDVSAWPTTTKFTQMIIDISSDINDSLLVESDVCTVGDGTFESKAIERIAGMLLEEKLLWIEEINKVKKEGGIPPPEPNLFDNNPIHIALRNKLEHIKTTDDEPAYTKRMGSYWSGGGAELD